MSTYDHTPHPQTTRRLSSESPGPVKVDDGRVGLNGRIGLRLTTLIGTPMFLAILLSMRGRVAS